MKKERAGPYERELSLLDERGEMSHDLPRRMTPLELSRSFHVYVVSDLGIAVCRPIRLEGEVLVVANGLGGAEFSVSLDVVFPDAHGAKRHSHYRVFRAQGEVCNQRDPRPAPDVLTFEQLTSDPVLLAELRPLTERAVFSDMTRLLDQLSSNRTLIKGAVSLWRVRGTVVGWASLEDAFNLNGGWYQAGRRFAPTSS